MIYSETKIDSDTAYILPMGDIHIGDKFVDYKLLQDNIDWVKSEPNARVILMGDMFNVATRSSKSSPFEQNLGLDEQIAKGIDLFRPIKEKILGAISGNHEARIEDFCMMNPLTPFCMALHIPYLGYSAVLSVVVGRIAYTAYVHHTTGGGKTPGSKINRVNALRSLVCNCDMYLGGHNHSLGVMPVTTRVVDTIHKSIVAKRQLLIDCGSYLEWDNNYAERMALEPTKLGSPRIRLNGAKRDIHCSV